MAINVDLVQRINQIKNDIPETEWTYFHLEAVDNFIYHLPNIENQRTRERISRKIAQCLQVVEQRHYWSYDRIDTYQFINRAYVFPISDDYKFELGFISKPNLFLFSIEVIALAFFLQWTLPLWLAVLITCTYVVWKVVRNNKKIRERKFY
jgi:hypothetical protein